MAALLFLRERERVEFIAYVLRGVTLRRKPTFCETDIAADARSTVYRVVPRGPMFILIYTGIYGKLHSDETSLKLWGLTEIPTGMTATVDEPWSQYWQICYRGSIFAVVRSFGKVCPEFSMF